VVDDHGHVLVVPTVQQFVDADNRQAIEQVGFLATSHNSLHDGADRLPPGAHHRAHRGLVAPLCEVGDVVFKREREPRADLPHATRSTFTALQRRQLTRRRS
jgi:hypothetical protein